MTAFTDVFERKEVKYRLDARQAETMRRALEGHMEPDAYGRTTVRSLYLDTPERTLIERSLDKPLYKEKLRLRRYGEATDEGDCVFVEIKKKYDHVVYKRRIGMNYQQAVDYLDGAPAPEESQISREIDWFCRFYEGLQPAMCIFYDRLAVFDREQPDLRVTFDSGIRWRADDLDLAHGTRGRLLLDPSMCLMEIKIPGAAPLWLARALSDAGVFPSHFSKYGAAYQTMQREEKNIRFNEKGEIYCA